MNVAFANGRFKFRRILPDVRSVEPEDESGDGSPRLRNLREGQELDVSSPVGKLRQVHTCECGKCSEQGKDEGGQP